MGQDKPQAVLHTRTAQVFDFVCNYRAQQGMAPTYREIAAACGISTTSVVQYHLDRLAGEGLIKRYRHVPRGIVVVESGVGE